MVRDNASNDPLGISRASAPIATVLVARWTDEKSKGCEQRFSRSFMIGRSQECELYLADDSVSRRHAEVSLEKTGWWVYDKGSANGTFLNGKRVQTSPLGQHCVLRVGVEGPVLSLFTEPVAASEPAMSAPVPSDDVTVVLPAFRRNDRPVCGPTRERESPNSETFAREAGRSLTADADQGSVSGQHARASVAPEAIAEHYFRSKDDDDVGDFTRAFRSAFRVEQRKQTRKHFAVLAGVIALAFAILAVSGFYLLWQQQQVEQARRLAIDLFYDIKELELDLARLRDRVRGSEDAALIAEMEANRAKLDAMSKRYDQYLEDHALLSRTIDQKELTVLRMARLFGECELNMPESFHAEVKNYIAKWQSSGRLARAIATAKSKGYVEIVSEAMRANDLPPQFFYLGLQESNFNERAIGPQTRYGIAKGAWQFIPSTAERFGLEVGPLADQRVYDPEDDRFDFAASADAAARYLRDIFDTDAQASGLLVMASYNWGEGNILKRIRSMPENPRERNFWKLVEKYKIPDETYNYVLYIFSAAVIGEKPRLFGFDFEKPL
ncbi:MAG: FHA domain-containing protein [Chromatiaceae bacterium]|nr:FHA domain-containing protein [Chromatiaceae bacterium]